MQIRLKHGFFKLKITFALAGIVDENIKACSLYINVIDKEYCNLVAQLII